MAKQQLGAEIITEEDLARLKEVVELTAQAEVLQQEAQAAFTIAQAIATFKESEAKRGEALQASFTKIQEADQAKNYEATVAALTEEKDRRTAVRDGVGGAPQEQMMANIRSLENERAKLEVKLTALADDEKTKAKNVRRIQENLNSTELSKSEKEALQNDLATAESVLSKVRKDPDSIRFPPLSRGAGSPLAIGPRHSQKKDRRKNSGPPAARSSTCLPACTAS
jgi:hypothetical protein